jgi:methionine-rich copper-binding protein CopC
MAVLRTSAGAAIAMLLTGTSVAEAHGNLTRATPPLGGTVKRPPKEVSLWFSEPLEAAFSRLEVLAEDGQRVDTGNSIVSADEPRRVSVSVKPLKPGSYRVLWRVLSVDTHTSSGDYSFRIAP